MPKSDKQLTIYYNPEDSRSSKTIAHAKLYKYPVLERDIINEPLTATQIVGLSRKLGVRLHDLIEQDNLDGQKGLTILDEHDLADYIEKNPALLKHPVAELGERAIFIMTPAEIQKFAPH